MCHSVSVTYLNVCKVGPKLCVSIVWPSDVPVTALLKCLPLMMRCHDVDLGMYIAGRLYNNAIVVLLSKRNRGDIHRTHSLCPFSVSVLCVRSLCLLSVSAYRSICYFDGYVVRNYRGC